MSGEAAKERVTPVRPNPNYLRISVLVTKRKASSNSEGSRDLQIYDVFVAIAFTVTRWLGHFTAARSKALH